MILNSPSCLPSRVVSTAGHSDSTASSPPHPATPDCLPAAAPDTEATVDFDQFFGRIHAGYQILAEENATLAAFVGARYSCLSTEIELSGPTTADLNGDGSKSRIDPVIGLHGYWGINERWFFHGGGEPDGKLRTPNTKTTNPSA